MHAALTASRDLSTQELAARLAAFVARASDLPAGSARVENLRRLAGGASRELWSLDVELARPGAARERLELVLRRDPPARAIESDRELELRLLRAAAQAGVPVPRVYFGTSDPAVLGSAFFLMERVAGETLPRRLLRDAEFEAARGAMTAQLGAILARIHAIDVTKPELAGLEAPPEGVVPARFEVERHAKLAQHFATEPHPVLDLAARWLLARAPQAPRRALVHGDYRIGNVIFDASGVRSILDWELAHVGDPVEDLGWLCVRAWRFGSDALAVGGIGTREQLLAAYRAAGGGEVDPAALRFWEAFGNFRLAVIFLNQARAFLDGKVLSVELAAIGRRVAEMEAELVRVMREEP